MTEGAPNFSIPIVVRQHVDECAMLRTTRSFLVRAADIKLGDLHRHDVRIAAHLDGVAIAGELGAKLAEQALERPGPGEIFTATVRALEDHRLHALNKLLAIAEALPTVQPHLCSAFGWVSAGLLRGVTKALLNSTSSFHRQVGLAACSFHGADAGQSLDAALVDPDVRLRSRAARMAGDSGRHDLLPLCVGMMRDEDPGCRFVAARSSLLLGQRVAATDVLEDFALRQNEYQVRAATWLLKSTQVTQVQAVLAALARDPIHSRVVLQGIAAAGDPHYVPWLIARMHEPRQARLAAQAFSFVTGLDLAERRLDSGRPDSSELVPSDQPESDDVAMDDDESLPWPDPQKIAAWWQANGPRFASGTRYFMGEPPSPAHCLGVLKTGFQRQRIAAAEYLCLMKPGTPMFNTAAPAWRQQRLLAQMPA